MQALADSLALIKMASLLKLTNIQIPRTNKVLQACNILLELGYISGFTSLNQKTLSVQLKFFKNKPVLRGLRLMSRSSSRIYFKFRHLTGKRVSGYIRLNSFIIFTTCISRVLYTDIECYMFGIGGEPLFVIS